MFLELTAAVFAGNALSMGSIAAVNLWLERKTLKAREIAAKKFLGELKEVEDKLVAEAEASALGKFKSLEKKTSNPKRTVKP